MARTAEHPASLRKERAKNGKTWIVVRFGRGSQQLGPAIRNTLRDLDSGLPVYVHTWVTELDHTLFAPHMATLLRGVLRVMGAMLSITLS